MKMTARYVARHNLMQIREGENSWTFQGRSVEAGGEHGRRSKEGVQVLMLMENNDQRALYGARKEKMMDNRQVGLETNDKRALYGARKEKGRTNGKWTAPSSRPDVPEGVLG